MGAVKIDGKREEHKKTEDSNKVMEKEVQVIYK